MFEQRCAILCPKIANRCSNNFSVLCLRKSIVLSLSQEKADAEKPADEAAPAAEKPAEEKPDDDVNVVISVDDAAYDEIAEMKKELEAFKKKEAEEKAEAAPAAEAPAAA